MSEGEQGTGQANPYAAPRANVAHPAPDLGIEGLIEGGRKVAAGRGASWIAEGFALFKKSPGVWIGTMLLFVFGSMIFAVIPIIGSLGLNLLMPVFIAGLLRGCRASEEDEPMEVAYLFAGFKENVGQLVLVGLLYMVGIMVIMIGVALVGGLGAFALFASMGEGAAAPPPEAIGVFIIVMLVALALSLPLVMAIWFAPALVIFHQQDAVPAMKQSFAGCLKNILPFLVYGVLFTLLMVAASIPLLLGWLVLWPTAMASVYKSYRDIYAPYPGTE